MSDFQCVDVNGGKFRGMPDPESGVRCLDAAECMEMVKNPKMREALDLVERITGKETAIKQMVRKQLAHSRWLAYRTREEKRRIDRAMRRAV